MKRNANFDKLRKNYLFVEVEKRVKAFMSQNPHAQLIKLSVGDTSLPLPPVVTAAMQAKIAALGSEEGYSGYGDERGEPPLRAKIAEVFYNNAFSPEQIFVSDGAACDLGRLHLLWGAGCTLAVPDPAYPGYLDTALAMGGEVRLLPALPENNFFPDLRAAKGCSVIVFCSPNNPTGHVSTAEQLKQLVDFALAEQCLIIFDAAYNLYTKNIRSIYQIPGAEKVAIEVGSFSKLVGFTGVRLGWTVVPQPLLQTDWNRIVTTFFNGASNIAQAGGLAALSPEGMAAIHDRIATYVENAHILKQAFQAKGYTLYGGEEVPYLWLRLPENKSSWELFDDFLHKYHLVTIPGAGFGPSGEGFLRLSAFGKRAHILEAARRLHAH